MHGRQGHGQNGERDGLTAVEKGERERPLEKGERTHSEERETNKLGNGNGELKFPQLRLFLAVALTLNLPPYPTDNPAHKPRKILLFLPIKPLPIIRVGLPLPTAQIKHPYLILLHLPTNSFPLSMWTSHFTRPKS